MALVDGQLLGEEHVWLSLEGDPVEGRLGWRELKHYIGCIELQLNKSTAQHMHWKGLQW